LLLKLEELEWGKVSHSTCLFSFPPQLRRMWLYSTHGRSSLSSGVAIIHHVYPRQHQELFQDGQTFLETAPQIARQDIDKHDIQMIAVF